MGLTRCYKTEVFLHLYLQFFTGDGGIVQSVTELGNQYCNVAANKSIRLSETDSVGLLGVHSVHVHMAPNRCKIWEAPTQWHRPT